MKLLTSTSMSHLCYMVTTAKKPSSISIVNLPSCLFILLIIIARGQDASKLFSHFGHGPCLLITVIKVESVGGITLTLKQL